MSIKYKKIEGIDLKVSNICLGTMTFGEQNSESEAHAQMDMAYDYGVNFFDTAEMYPVPANEKTQGLTEKYIGTWLKNKKINKSKIVIASKVVGKNLWTNYLRNGKHRLDSANIISACEDSLKRLQIDCIDLYQIHWPQRATNFFGQLTYKYSDAVESNELTPCIEETLKALSHLKSQGKIKAIGVSNETAWGVMTYLKCHALAPSALPRIVSIQNPYSLLNRTFEVNLAEIARLENVELLAYSPLGFGVLSGKYLNNQAPKDARLTRFPQFSRYTNERGIRATEAYVNLAREFSLSPAQMALQFVTTRPFVLSNIIGATNLLQLKENLESVHVDLKEEIFKEIERIFSETQFPSP